jgi:hypothetical protein
VAVLPDERDTRQRLGFGSQPKTFVRAQTGRGTRKDKNEVSKV